MTDSEYVAEVAPSDIESLSAALARHDVSAVVFDLDGTLADSVADLMEGVRRSFRHYNLGEIPSNYLPTALSGTMVDGCVLITLPVDAPRWPGLAALPVVPARFDAT